MSFIPFFVESGNAVVQSKVLLQISKLCWPDLFDLTYCITACPITGTEFLKMEKGWMRR